MSVLNLFKSSAFADLLEKIDLRLVDIGARGGMDTDLLPAAWATTAIGFEPEPEECRTLNLQPSAPWRRTQYVPTAIGGNNGMAVLHIPPNSVGASLLPHNPAMVPLYGHPELHTIERCLNVETLTLDEACEQFNLGYPDYLKIDVEGAELDILSAAPKALQHCSAIKVETSFLEQRKEQPLMQDVTAYLVSQGFVLADIRDIHRWRRRSLAGHPYLSQWKIPYSRGIAAQCDLIFLRNYTEDVTDRVLQRLILVASILGYFDYAVGILRQRGCLEQLFLETTRTNPIDELSKLSRLMGRSVVKAEMAARLRSIVPLVRSLVVGIPSNSLQLRDY